MALLQKLLRSMSCQRTRPSGKKTRSLHQISFLLSLRLHATDSTFKLFESPLISLGANSQDLGRCLVAHLLEGSVLLHRHHYEKQSHECEAQRRMLDRSSIGGAET
jgi:hypothetical protein